jgi:hypothetical protein
MQIRHIVAGTAARTTAQCVIHPFDTVKTRLQVHILACCLLAECWLQCNFDFSRFQTNDSPRILYNIVKDNRTYAATHAFECQFMRSQRTLESLRNAVATLMGYLPFDCEQYVTHL